jgi:signal transduction histidine kinase
LDLVQGENPTSASILLVDDLPANLLALEAVLEPLGHRIVKAHSGEEALKCLLQDDFALILMDVMMPHLDGFQTVALIKQRLATANVPIVFVSAIAKEVQDSIKGFQYGAVDYITKPLDPDMLRAKVSVLIALHLQAERIIRQRALLLERQFELRQQQSERDAAVNENQMKDRFLTMISHELRAPLNQIVGWTDLLLQGGLDEHGTRDALETIERNSQIQCRLVDDLIDVSRMLLGKMAIARKRLDLARLIRQAVEAARPAAEHRHISLVADIEPLAGIYTHGDSIRLSQVIENLLSNGIKFTPPAGTVEVRLRQQGGFAHIEVRDTGIGIDERDLPFVFERFWQADMSSTRAYHGLGLGLTIVRQLVELHGGTVTATSEGAGRGATIAVRLPLADTLSEAASSEAPR